MLAQNWAPVVTQHQSVDGRTISQEILEQFAAVAGLSTIDINDEIHSLILFYYFYYIEAPGPRRTGSTSTKVGAGTIFLIDQSDRMKVDLNSTVRRRSRAVEGGGTVLERNQNNQEGKHVQLADGAQKKNTHTASVFSLQVMPSSCLPTLLLLIHVITSLFNNITAKARQWMYQDF